MALSYSAIRALITANETKQGSSDKITGTEIREVDNAIVDKIEEVSPVGVKWVSGSIQTINTEFPATPILRIAVPLDKTVVFWGVGSGRITSSVGGNVLGASVAMQVLYKVKNIGGVVTELFGHSSAFNLVNIARDSGAAGLQFTGSISGTDMLIGVDSLITGQMDWFISGYYTIMP